ncbi:hypothetical protein D3C85_894450 [compost metagenome]
MGQFQDARDRLHPFGAFCRIGRDLRLVDQGEEVQAELRFRKITLLDQGETQYTGIEVQ